MQLIVFFFRLSKNYQQPARLNILNIFITEQKNLIFCDMGVDIVTSFPYFIKYIEIYLL